MIAIPLKMAIACLPPHAARGWSSMDGEWMGFACRLAPVRQALLAGSMCRDISGATPYLPRYSFIASKRSRLARALFMPPSNSKRALAMVRLMPGFYVEHEGKFVVVSAKEGWGDWVRYIDMHPTALVMGKPCARIYIAVHVLAAHYWARGFRYSPKLRSPIHLSHLCRVAFDVERGTAMDKYRTIKACERLVAAGMLEYSRNKQWIDIAPNKEWIAHRNAKVSKKRVAG